MGTHFKTQATSSAFVLIQLEGHNVFEIDERISCHQSSPYAMMNLAVSHKPNPKAIEAIWRGTAQRISFRTPDKDV